MFPCHSTLTAWSVIAQPSNALGTIIEYDFKHQICPKINMANSAEICHDRYQGAKFWNLGRVQAYGSTPVSHSA